MIFTVWFGNATVSPNHIITCRMQETNCMWNCGLIAISITPEAFAVTFAKMAVY